MTKTMKKTKPIRRKKEMQKRVKNNKKMGLKKTTKRMAIKRKTETRTNRIRKIEKIQKKSHSNFSSRWKK